MTLSTIGGASPATKANDNLDFLNDPLLPGEDREKYQQLLTLIGETIKPRDVFEQFWVADVANQVWETVRYRVVTLGLIAVTTTRALEAVLGPLVPNGLGHLDLEWPSKAAKMAHEYVVGETEAVEKVHAVLQTAGLDLKAVNAEATALRVAEFSRINQLLAKAETRRVATLRAIERHRTGLGALLQKVAEQFEKAELRQARGEPAAAKLAA